MDIFFTEAVQKTRMWIEKELQIRCNVYSDMCCGQPPFSGGFEDLAYTHARSVWRTLTSRFGNPLPPVVLLASSCRKFLQEAMEAEVIPAFPLYEFTTWVVDEIQWKAKKNCQYTAKVSVHISCSMTFHLRQANSFLQLLQEIPGLEIVNKPSVLYEGDLPVCCGFGGVFSVVEASLARAMGQTRYQILAEPPAEEIVTADMSCALHMLRSAKNPRIPIRYIGEILFDACCLLKSTESRDRSVP